MPIYDLSDSLHNDEWILLQVKEGPCNAGCEYCYENEPIKKALAEKQSVGLVPKAPLAEMHTAELARFVDSHKDVLDVEMELEEVRGILRLVKDAGIDRVGLIGSEPTAHSQYTSILDFAHELGMSVLVYTSGLMPDRLQHPAVQAVVLHLDYGRIGNSKLMELSHDGSLPPSAYMSKIIRLLEARKEVHLRINFTTADLPESQLVMNFFDKVPSRLKHLTCLKYSVTTRVAGDSSINYFTPDTLRDTAPALLAFVDEFSARHPEVRMISERPLFPCSFDEATWREYVVRGGFLSTCDMEFTFYAKQGLALCPPSRSLCPPEKVSTPGELRRQIARLRSFLRANYVKPSFSVCEPCEYRMNLSCQGGCLGYKVMENHLVSIEPALVAVAV
jgi:organic radical activating enzyme